MSEARGQSNRFGTASHRRPLCMSIFRPCYGGRKMARLHQIGRLAELGTAMTKTNGPAEHHASAAAHHEQAAQYHREASRHYQIGKDYAHAAHQALTAHCHGLRALEHGQAASAFYAEHAATPLPGYLARSSDISTSTALASPITLGVVDHHVIAANHHEAAEQHHEQAEKHCDAEHYVRACHETKNALDHGKHALFHGDQAALHHMEHYGSHPSAELV